MRSRLAVLLSMCGLAMATGALRRSSTAAGAGAGASVDVAGHHGKKHAYGLSIETNMNDAYSKAVNNGQKLVTCREPGVNYTATPANCIRCGYDLTPAELKKLKEETKHIVDLKKKLKEAEAKGKTSKEYTDARKTYDEAKAKAIKAHKKHHSRVKGTCSTADVPSLKVLLPVSAALPPGNATWGCLVNTAKDTDANSVTNWNHTGHVAVNGHTYATEFDSSRCGDKGTCKYCTGAKAVGKCKAHKKHPGVYKCAPLCGKKCQQARLEAKKAMAALK